MDTAPLLTAIGGLPGPNILQDHPAFLRACHSPWRFIPQNILVILRGIVLAFIVATGVMVTHYKLSEESELTNWRHFFDFSIVSFIMVFLYHLITFSWTFTHLYYPHREDCVGGIESWIVAAMSLPRNMASLRKQFYFTMFYTATVVACFMNSTIYWLITRQRDIILWPYSSHSLTAFTVSDLFGEGWFNAFVIVALYGITSAIMATEVFWLNSIKRPIAIGSHILGLLFLSGLYLGWAAIGKIVTDWYPFFWLDEDEVGSQEAVTAYCIGFVLLAPMMYTLMQGFVGIREGLTRSLAEARAVAAAEEALDD
ncbi:hypothetical protein BGZ61DRAFT_361294 [Ilyonectria robusta]|uniref:uncharacterized protein n=1 Tax=Ilyonectria robusta TaxID=1079257 RepID=UPI001E8DBE83|nr:uncharacterized protein BGZ61DRAFT_361294 [Ilyonectria robusta]KAH8675096.1 hypothetical protein BGZ61DRAFT_361294 [Ilyonectria robusta]